jgi:phosphatidyl-myo-inositol alpha-mannosyltransferase
VEPTPPAPIRVGLTTPVDPAGPDGTSPLTIALVCPYSLSRPGGVQGQVVGLARALERRGHRVTVLAPVDAVTDAPEGVHLVATGRSVALPANGSVAPVTLSVPAVVRALRLLRSGGFDVIHVHEPFTPGVPFGLLVGRGLPPLVATFHRSGRSPFYDALKPVTHQLARRFAVRCAVSPAARATAEQALGGHYDVGFNGVEVDRFLGVDPWPRTGPVVLFLGRHEERKGLGVLLEAFDRLRRTGAHGSPGGPRSAPTLWVAGDGPQTAALRRRHPEADDLRWLGVLTEEEKLRRLAAADVLGAPSLSGESFGMVLLEAMAARAVVVASDIDGYREASGGHALLVPPDDPSALADGLARALADPAPGSSASAPVDTGATGASGDPEGRQAWLDEAASWADHWSMERLAGWYETRYRALVVRPRP